MHGKVSGFLASKEPFWRKIGIAACAVQRVDPGDHLKQGVKDLGADLCCQSLKAAGELGRVDLMAEMQKAMAKKSSDIKFWAAWAAVLCGDRQQALSSLFSMVKQNGKHTLKALSLSLRAMSSSDARDLLALLRKQSKDDPSKQRLVIQGIGIRGESEFIPWLVEQMKIPELARVAGESFTLITGVDLAYDDLEKDKPDSFEAGPTENPEDDDVDLDADEDLPWPDTQLIQQWWNTHKAEFTSGTRYLMGKPVSSVNCKMVLNEGMQRQRQAAALELTLMDDNVVLFETSAVGMRQQKVLLA